MVCSASLDISDFKWFKCVSFHTFGSHALNSKVFSPETYPYRWKTLYLLQNTLAFECILRNDPDRLEKLDFSAFNGVAGSVNVFHYAAALGNAGCFSVLIRRLGVSSPLLVDPDGSCKVLHCCDGAFPFGYPEDILGFLLDHFDAHSFHELYLESATTFGALKLIALVLAARRDVDIAELNLLLSLACEYGHIDCVYYFLERGADVNANFTIRGQPLESASTNGHIDCIRLLLDRGADPKSSKSLFLCCANGRTDCARLLMEHGADVNSAPLMMGSFTGLMVATRAGHADFVRLLLEHGADANVWFSDNDTTALTLACGYGRTDCARLLLEHGADVNAKGRFGKTPLMSASKSGHVDCLRLLLEHGADATVRGAMAEASAGNYTDCVRLLLEHGVDVNGTGGNHSSTLMHVCRFGHLDLARFLLKIGANIHATDASGATALQYASAKGHIDCVRLLLEHGADVNHFDARAETALMCASEEGHTDCARVLIEAGADTNASNGGSSVCTPLMRASRNGHLFCCHLLLFHGAKVDAKSLSSRSELEKRILDRSPKSSLTGATGWTALMFASQQGHVACIRLLLGHGADTRCKSLTGWTALSLATENGQTDCKNLLLEASK